CQPRDLVGQRWYIIPHHHLEGRRDSSGAPRTQTPTDLTPRVVSVQQQDPHASASKLNENRLGDVSLTQATGTEDRGQAARREKRLVEPVNRCIGRVHEVND